MVAVGFHGGDGEIGDEDLGGETRGGEARRV